MRKKSNWAGLRTDFLYDVVGTVTENCGAEMGLLPDLPFQQWHKDLVNDYIEFIHIHSQVVLSQNNL